MKWKPRNLRALADIVCGNVEHFEYRSSSYITEFFGDCDLDYVHDGSTRWAWIAEKLKEILAQPQRSPSIPPGAFVKVIRRVLDKARRKALAALNIVLAREGWEAFLRRTRAGPAPPHRDQHHRANRKPPPAAYAFSILNLFIVTNLPLPKGALPPRGFGDMDDDISF